MNDITRYSQIRKIGMDLNTKLFRVLSGDEIRIAARAVGLLKKKRLILESEDEMDRFTDFAINDYLNMEQKNAVERYFYSNKINLSLDEEKIINSLLLAKPSLFEISKIDASTSSVWLRDAIKGSKEIKIIDKGFSQSPAIVDLLVYTRIVSVEGISMTSGAPMLFENPHYDFLLSKYRLLVKAIKTGSDQAKQTIAFFKLYKKMGFHQVVYK